MPQSREGFLSSPIAAGSGTACTEMYLVTGLFDDEAYAQYCAAYLRCRFTQVLISPRKVSQHVSKDVFALVPDPACDYERANADLYRRYGLADKEIAFVESAVVPLG